VWKRVNLLAAQATVTLSGLKLELYQELESMTYSKNKENVLTDETLASKAPPQSIFTLYAAMLQNPSNRLQMFIIDDKQCYSDTRH